MFTFLPSYGVLICRQHCCAVYGLDRHLDRQHGLPIAKRRELLTAYEGLDVSAPEQVPLPTPYSAPIVELGVAQDALLCCHDSDGDSDNRCSFITTSQNWMRKHINQQHGVKLTRWSSTSTTSYQEHATQLWRPVKVQTFFRQRRYVRYFIVQEEENIQQEQAQEQEQEQYNGQQQEQRRQLDRQQTLASLSAECKAIELQDREAISQIAKEALVHDRTG